MKKTLDITVGTVLLDKSFSVSIFLYVFCGGYLSTKTVVLLCTP